MLQVGLLGGFQLHYSKKPITAITSARLRALIAYLILHRHAPVSRQQLSGLFWPDTSETQARTNLRNLIHQLRQFVPFFKEFIFLDAYSLEWRKDSAYILDVEAFERCLEVNPGQPMQQETLEHAVQIYTGDLLPDCFDDWIGPIRERLRLAYLSTLEALADMAEESREYRAALGYTRRVVTADPLSSAANLQLIRLHMLLGAIPAALKSYQTFARFLSQELGVEPDAEIQEMVHRLPHSGKKATMLNETALMIGRKTEWRKMLSIWQDASGGLAQVLFISGEAGIGKTRLVEELARWATLQGIHIAMAYCYPAEGNLPYAPIVSWLRAQPLPHLEKIWLAELARLLPEVHQSYSGLPKVEPLREAWQRQHFFEALAHTLLAKKQNQLLILEDIHWCDRDTLEWLHYLLRFAPQASLLIVATERSGEVVPEHPLQVLKNALSTEGKLVELNLLPLSEAETVQLANQVHRQSSGQGLSAEEASQICREAEGNPLFVIEMVRLGPAMPCPDPPCDDWLISSERVQAVLTRRIGQVNPNTQEITCLAATIGREFDLGVLHQASQESDEKIVEAIDEMLQRQIIREISPETYDFTHDLLRQAALSVMSTAHRRLLHRKVAEAYLLLDQAAAHLRDAEIASHYERAGLTLQAIRHYCQAAESSAGIFANSDAQAYFQRAVEMAESNGVGSSNGLSPAEFAHLLERLGDLLALDGKYPQAQSCFERSLAQLFSKSGIWQSQVYRKMSDIWVEQYRHDQAYAALDQAEQVLQVSPRSGTLLERQEWLQIQLDRLQLYYWDNHPERMEALIQQIEPQIAAVGRVEQQANLLSTVYMARIRRERYRLSAETVRIAWQRLEQVGKLDNPYELAWCQFQCGFGLLWHGDPAAARKWLARANDAFARMGVRKQQLRCLSYLSVVSRKLHEPDTLREELPPLLELARTMNEYSYLGIGLANQGWLAWQTGDAAQAIHSCEEAIQAWGEFRGSTFHALAEWVLLAVACDREDLEGAEAATRALLDPNPTFQPLTEPMATLLALALAACEVEDQSAVWEPLNRALEAARNAGEL